jgi:hypothetical protein
MARARALGLVLAVSVVTTLLGAGIAEARPIEPSPGARVVTPGAACTGPEAGDVGKTGSGQGMLCVKAPGDPTLRWRPLDSSTHRLVGALERLYLAYGGPGREPDGAGFAYWIGLRVDGVPLVVISEHFAWSMEFYFFVGGGDPGSFIHAVFGRTMGRPPEIPEWGFWMYALNSGAITRGGMMALFTQSPEFRAATGTI